MAEQQQLEAPPPQVVVAPPEGEAAAAAVAPEAPAPADSPAAPPPADTRTPEEIEADRQARLKARVARLPQPLDAAGTAVDGEAILAEVRGQLDPLYEAVSLLRRRRFQDAVRVAESLLDKHPKDQAAWFIKCKSLIEETYMDDTELETEGVAEETADCAAGSSTSADLGCGDRSSGRFIRLGTASLIPDNPSEFINVDRLDFKRYATRPALAKARLSAAVVVPAALTFRSQLLFRWLFHHEKNVAKALELASEATKACEYKDWWWKAQTGKCFFRLGLLRDAERHFTSSLRDQDMVSTQLWLAKVFMRLDQPNKALDVYRAGSERHPGETSLILGAARIHDMLGESANSVPLFKRALICDSSNIEAIACLASNHFYSDQPELALRYYRRLLQMGVDTAELWNNLGLACFYSQQYDMTLQCFDRALAIADDNSMADVWFNIGQVAIGLGDIGLAYQAFKISVSINPYHAEAYNNLGVLEMRKGNIEHARSNFLQAQQLGPYLHDPYYNAALLYFRLGDFQESAKQVLQSLRIFPEHEDSKELKRQLDDLFSGM
eukprot:m51a1_g9530 putative tetratricopeptide repeat protein 8-like isoform x2 (553) ;mRNA; f:775481-777656